jgi:protein-S-isoprenylcysteine O-methyltransferase Ste14
MFQSGFILTVQLLPGILLILLGWGFDDLTAFFLNPARLGLAAVVLVGAVTAVVFRLDSRPLRRGLTPADNQSWQLALLLLLSCALLWFLPFADRRSILTFHHSYLDGYGPHYCRYLGLILCVIGVTVRLLALKELGEHFSAYVTLQPNHQLVRQGIYGIIRHPLYLSLLFAPAGIALVFSSYLALPILILATAFVFDRIGKEERLLGAHFGAEFDGYRSRTWKLIPFVL